MTHPCTEVTDDDGRVWLVRPMVDLPRTRPQPAGPAEQLAKRLEEGHAKIEQAAQRGEDVEAWSAFWVDLLHEYEAECRPSHDASGRYS